MNHPRRRHLSRVALTLLFYVSSAAIIASQNVRTTPYGLRDVSGVPSGSFGQRLAGISDLDGNGADDLIVASPSASLIANGAGAVEARDGMTGAVLWRRDGTTAFEGFGTTVARIDDIDGDSLADVAVGRQVALPVAGTLVSRIDLLSGGDGSLIRALTLPPSVSTLFAIHVVANIDDLTGDGVRDLVVTSAPATPGPFVRLDLMDPVVGNSLVTTTIVTNAPGPSFHVPQLISGRDLTGDGVGDLVLGLPDGSGAVFPTTAAGQVIALDGATLTVIWNISGIENSERLGQGLEWLGDVTGDGRDDLAIGAPAPVVGATGRVGIHDGATGAMIGAWTRPAGDLAWQFGHTIANVTPAGSATERLVIGCSPFAIAPGAAAIVGYEVVIGATPQMVARLESNGTIGGTAVVRNVGDVNGDGLPDAALGVPGADPLQGGLVALFRSRGAGSYGAGNPAVHTLSLDALGSPTVLTLRTSGGAQGSTGVLVASLAQAGIAFAGGQLLVDPGPGISGIFATQFHFNGESLTQLFDPALYVAISGYSIFFQSFEFNPAAPGGLFLSDGLQVTF